MSAVIKGGRIFKKKRIVLQISTVNMKGKHGGEVWSLDERSLSWEMASG